MAGKRLLSDDRRAGSALDSIDQMIEGAANFRMVPRFGQSRGGKAGIASRGSQDQHPLLDAGPWVPGRCMRRIRHD